jgi:hypothetical protein
MRILPIILLICLCVVFSAWTSSRESKKSISKPSLTRASRAPVCVPRQNVTGHDAAPTLPPGTSVCWYGFYDPMTGTAVKDEMWTFDHGAMDPFEGWTTRDSTENDFLAWRRITPGIWGGNFNIPPAPVIAGTASVWLGFFEHEAVHAGYKAGLGYGNRWCQQLRTPEFVSGSGSATLSFDYFYDMESNYDSLYVVLGQGGDRTTITGFSGKSGSPGSPLYFSQSFSPTVSDTFNILFEFISDESFSDADSAYPTDLGPFCLDNVDLQGTSLAYSGSPPGYAGEANRV